MPSIEPDSFQLVTLALEPGNRRLNDPNVQSPNGFHRFTITRERAIRAEHQVLAPKQQLNREVYRILIAARHCDRLIATLPAIAVWTVMHGAAIKLPEVFDLRQFIDESGREQKHAPSNTLAGLQDRRKLAITTLDIHDFHFSKFNRLVAPQLIAADLQELRRDSSRLGKGTR